MLSAESHADIFQAIAEPRRRRILELLKEGEQPVQNLVREFEISFAAVSQHLRVLREAGLVDRRREGRQRLYRLNPVPLKQIHDWTALYEQAWQGCFERLRLRLEEGT